MHEPEPTRTLEQIDQQLNVERRLIAYEDRGGPKSAALADVWARIDQLLDERSALRHLVPDLPDPPPRPLDGPVVHDA
jgi:hypothetical protein